MGSPYISHKMDSTAATVETSQKFVFRVDDCVSSATCAFLATPRIAHWSPRAAVHPAARVDDYVPSLNWTIQSRHYNPWHLFGQVPVPFRCLRAVRTTTAHPRIVCAVNYWTASINQRGCTWPYRRPECKPIGFNPLRRSLMRSPLGGSISTSNMYRQLTAGSQAVVRSVGRRTTSPGNPPDVRTVQFFFTCTGGPAWPERPRTLALSNCMLRFIIYIYSFIHHKMVDTALTHVSFNRYLNCVGQLPSLNFHQSRHLGLVGCLGLTCSVARASTKDVE
jgi:hypothetical protein